MQTPTASSSYSGHRLPPPESPSLSGNNLLPFFLQQLRTSLPLLPLKIKEVHVSIRNPQITKLGMEFLNSSAEDSVYAYPYADMLLSSQNPKVYSSFSEWGRGWADPEIRRQRLRGRKHRASRTRKSRRKRQDLSTVRGRLAAKFSKLKR